MSESIPHLHPDLHELVGRTIAERYRVDSLLGVGGMGAVFRAHHLGLKRDVAIKVLHPDLSRDSEISARFDREAHSSSRLDHPNCLQVTDYGSTEDGMKFMVMQVLEGGELSALLGRPMPPARAVELCVQILRGLEHAHKKGVVHRDIKPENVFITRDHEGEEILKLVDFGIAKIVDGPVEGTERHKTRAGLVFGTPAYMSPEQAAGVEADERADIYSVGIILYQMLAGRLPFDHRDPVSLVRMQVSQDPPPLPPNVPPVLAAAVEKMLAKSRDDRFQSAGDAADTLEQIVPMLESGVIDKVELPQIIAAATGPILTDMQTHLHKVARSRRGAALGGGLVVLLLAWIAWPSSKNDDDDAPRDEKAVQKEQAEPDPGLIAQVLSAASPRPDEQTIAEIDRLLLANKLDEAEKLLTPLRDTFPGDPVLSWRQGRLLSKRKRKESQALAAYGAAIDGDPMLLEDKDFYSEIYELLRKSKLRDEALEVALHKMGEHGHKFLLELVNDEKKPLGYHDRQRALEELARNDDNMALVNEPLNRALDLLQAKQALTPCTAYREALRAVAENPDPYYEPRVKRAPVPDASDVSEASQPGEVAACEGLTEARDEVLTQLAILRGEDPEQEDLEIDLDPAPAAADPDDAPATQTAKKPATKKKKTTTAKKSNDCDKPFALFKKGCR
jgi:serine/threonine protein kinase